MKLIASLFTAILLFAWTGEPTRGGDGGVAPSSDASSDLMLVSLAKAVSKASEDKPPPLAFKPIHELTTNITPSTGDLPEDYVTSNVAFQPRAFAPITYMWTASGLCHKPLYFEDVQLERYGHTCCPLLQPAISGAHFFLTVPIVPYKMGLETPNECIYALGYYRPGSWAPYMLDPLPLSVRGALFEAGAIVGGVFAFP